MNQELKDLMDARNILSRAYLDTIPMWAAHDKVWRAIEYIDKQISPMLLDMLTDDAVEA